MPEDNLVVAFAFSGGLADERQLDVYDAARFQYGAARLIYTVEALRQSGHVPLKIHRDYIKADFRITAAEPGSFLQTIIEGAAAVAPTAADCFLKVPIKAAIAWALEKLFPKKATEDKIVETVKAMQAGGLALSQEETKRLELRSQETLAFIGLVRELIQRPGVAPDHASRLEKGATELEASEARQELIKPYEQEFDKVPFDEQSRLIGQTRKQMVEIGFPLKRSADSLSVLPGLGEKPISAIDIDDLTALEGNVRDKEPEVFEGSIKSYDKETGWGKWRSEDFTAPISFLVPADRRRRVLGELLAAMTLRKTEISFFVVRDAAKLPKFLIFDEFADGVLC